jgi:hypothetical protein
MPEDREKRSLTPGLQSLGGGFNLDQFQYELANELGINTNTLINLDRRSLEDWERRTHSARSIARRGQGNNR